MHLLRWMKMELQRNTYGRLLLKFSVEIAQAVSRQASFVKKNVMALRIRNDTLDVVKISTRWFQDRIKESPYKSQRQLAFCLGLDPAALSYILSGQRRLQIHEAEAMAKALNVSLEDVLANVGVKSLDKIPDPFPNIPKDIRRLMAQLSEKDKVWEIIRAVLNSKGR